MIFFVSWKLSLIMIAVIPVIILVAAKFGKFVKRIQGEETWALKSF